MENAECKRTIEAELALQLMRSRLIRRKEVEKYTGLKKSSIYQMAKDGTFPAGVKVSERARAWRLGDVLDWVASRPTA